MKRFLLVALTVTMLLGTTLTASAATSKTGRIVTGADILVFVEDNIPTVEEMEQQDMEAEVAVLIQTRAIASLPRHGFTVINYGAVLSEDGSPEGELPKLIHKKNPKKNSYKYITEVTPQLFMHEFTNTNEDYPIYQKKGEYDAHEEVSIYYASIGAEGKKQPVALNVAGLTDEANAQYIDPDAQFYSYELKDPETDEVIGQMFIEVKKPSAKPEKERLK